MGDAVEGTVREIYSRAERGDIAGVLELCDPAMELNDPVLPGGGTFAGHDGMRRFLGEWRGAFEELTFEIEEAIAAPDGGVLALVHQSGRAREGGVLVEVRDAHLWSVAGGVATRLDLFLDRDAARRAAGV
jgi:ketosteroid isomerase-like protein